MAILICPPWNCSNIFKERENRDKEKQTISIEHFTKNFKIPTSVMKDGLVFIWVEKEIISDIIKCFEEQDFFYVENVCYVMLDQNKKRGKLNLN